MQSCVDSDNEEECDASIPWRRARAVRGLRNAPTRPRSVARGARFTSAPVLAWGATLSIGHRYHSGPWRDLEECAPDERRIPIVLVTIRIQGHTRELLVEEEKRTKSAQERRCL